MGPHTTRALSVLGVLALQGRALDERPLWPRHWASPSSLVAHKLELGQIQPQMAQKPVLRGEVGARALRVRSVSREEVWASAGVQVSMTS
jgi:hypothetical protein